MLHRFHSFITNKARSLILGLAGWMVGFYDIQLMAAATVWAFEAMKAMVECGKLKYLSPKEKLWIEGLNAETHIFMAVEQYSELKKLAEPLVPADKFEAAQDYVKYLDNCAIADAEKRRAAVVRMKQHFPRAKGHELSLAVELAVHQLRCPTA